MASGRTATPETARPMGPAYKILLNPSHPWEYFIHSKLSYHCLHYVFSRYFIFLDIRNAAFLFFFFSSLDFFLIFIFTFVVNKLSLSFIIFSYITLYFDINLDSFKRNFAVVGADAG
jgi:hypothetical protein